GGGQFRGGGEIRIPAGEGPARVVGVEHGDAVEQDRHLVAGGAGHLDAVGGFGSDQHLTAGQRGEVVRFGEERMPGDVRGIKRANQERARRRGGGGSASAGGLGARHQRRDRDRVGVERKVECEAAALGNEDGDGPVAVSDAAPGGLLGAGGNVGEEGAAGGVAQRGPSEGGEGDDRAGDGEAGFGVTHHAGQGGGGGAVVERERAEQE